MEDINNDNELLIRWINGELSEEELAAFQKTEDYKIYNTIINEVDQWQVRPLNLENSFDELNAKKNKKEESKAISWYNQPMVRWAAVFAFIATAIVYFVAKSQETTVYKTTIGESKEVILPDNSKVFLRPESSIAFKRNNWGKQKRELLQTGTVYYDVKKGLPFEVNFGENKVDVLGTTFEITNNQDYTSVICYSGRVRVTTNNSAFELKEKEALQITPELYEYTVANDWSLNLIRFEKAPLKSVFDSIEKTFNVKISANSTILERKFTGAYSDTSLDQALKMICVPMNITFKVDGRNVTLK